MAVTLEQLLDLETETENVFGTYLRTNLGLTDSYTSDSQADLPTPRIDCWAVLVSHGTHQNVIPSGSHAGRRIYDQNTVRINLQLVYAPDQTNFAVSPGALRGKFRSLLTDYYGIQAGFDVKGLLMLAPDTLRQVDGDRSIDNERKEETITCGMEVQLFFNPAALAQVS